ncbi:hypothetical protein LWI29_016368 [Acer saccharum]|uniref:Uncharacterized protein n=1 Tax=Acer saccharum TaxID=4024 RepID=A0AA39SU47_ACESA|nr:hypothetical protein LWI29_016368 [Acer saccharum]
MPLRALVRGCGGSYVITHFEMRSLMAVETLAMAFSGEKMALFCSRPSHKLTLMGSFREGARGRRGARGGRGRGRNNEGRSFEAQEDANFTQSRGADVEETEVMAKAVVTHHNFSVSIVENLVTFKQIAGTERMKMRVAATQHS